MHGITQELGVELGGVAVPARGLVDERDRDLRRGTDQEQRYHITQRARLRQLQRQLLVHDQRRGTAHSEHHEPGAQRAVVFGVVLVVTVPVLLALLRSAGRHAGAPRPIRPWRPPQQRESTRR
jgi:hypothetical protein